MDTNQASTEATTRIKILGPGCGNCRRLEAHAHEAVRKLSIEADFEKVQDIDDIMAYGIMRTPGLVVNERVLVFGRVPSVEEIVSLIAEHLHAVEQP